MAANGASAIGQRLAWLLQAFGVVMLGLGFLLIWEDKGNELIDSVAFASPASGELAAPLFLAVAALLVLGGYVVAHAVQTLVEPYDGTTIGGALRRFAVDALGYVLLAAVVLVATGGPARSRLVVGGLILWHLALLIGHALRGGRGASPGRAMLGHSIAIAVYLVVLVGLTLLGHGMRTAWWVGLGILVLAAGVSLPAVWRGTTRTGAGVLPAGQEEARPS